MITYKQLEKAEGKKEVRYNSSLTIMETGHTTEFVCEASLMGDKRLSLKKGEEAARLSTVMILIVGVLKGPNKIRLLCGT